MAGVDSPEKYEAPVGPVWDEPVRVRFTGSEFRCSRSSPGSQSGRVDRGREDGFATLETGRSLEIGQRLFGLESGDNLEFWGGTVVGVVRGGQRRGLSHSTGVR